LNGSYKADADTCDEADENLTYKADVDVSYKPDGDRLSQDFSDTADEHLADEADKCLPVKSGVVLSGVIDETQPDDTDVEMCSLTATKTHIKADRELINGKTDVSESTSEKTDLDLPVKTKEDVSDKADTSIKQKITNSLPTSVAGADHTADKTGQSPAAIRRKKKDKPGQKSGGSGDSAVLSKSEDKMLKAGSKRKFTGEYRLPVPVRTLMQHNQLIYSAM
jgi:hypothetical protein